MGLASAIAAYHTPTYDLGASAGSAPTPQRPVALVTDPAPQQTGQGVTASHDYKLDLSVAARAMLAGDGV